MLQLPQVHVGRILHPTQAFLSRVQDVESIVSNVANACRSAAISPYGFRRQWHSLLTLLKGHLDPWRCSRLRSNKSELGNSQVDLAGIALPKQPRVLPSEQAVQQRRLLVVASLGSKSCLHDNLKVLAEFQGELVDVHDVAHSHNVVAVVHHLQAVLRIVVDARGALAPNKAALLLRALHESVLEVTCRRERAVHRRLQAPATPRAFQVRRQNMHNATVHRMEEGPLDVNDP